MKLTTATVSQIPELTRLSKAAFESDTCVGSSEAGGPPGYDSEEWYMELQKIGCLFAAAEDDRLVGGALLFRDADSPWHLHVGRIFIDPALFRTGYGIKLMKAAETLYSGVTEISLDTPIWNTRTNRFYTKLGYTENSRDSEFIYYQKYI